MRLLVLLIALGLLTGCATKEEIEAQKLPVVRLSPEQIVKVEAAVRKVLPRPNGANFFKGYRAGKNPDGTIMVCGWAGGPDELGWPTRHMYTGVINLKGEFIDVKSQHRGPPEVAVACFTKGIGLHAWDD